MNIDFDNKHVFWVYNGEPCIHNGTDIKKVLELPEYSAVAVIDDGTLYVYNYNGFIRFIIRAEGPVAFHVTDIESNGYIYTYHPPGKNFVRVIDWDSGQTVVQTQY